MFKKFYTTCLHIDFDHSFEVEVHPNTLKQILHDAGEAIDKEQLVPECMWVNFERVGHSFFKMCGIKVFLNSALPEGEFKFLYRVNHIEERL